MYKNIKIKLLSPESGEILIGELYGIDANMKIEEILYPIRSSITTFSDTNFDFSEYDKLSFFDYIKTNSIVTEYQGNIELLKIKIGNDEILEIKTWYYNIDINGDSISVY